MALHVELKPFEKFNLNGALVANGPQRVRLQIESGARMLREKDIMLEQDATTPAKRLYFFLQKAYLNDRWAEYQPEVVALLPLLGKRLAATDVVELNTRLGEGDLYRALRAVRRMIETEESDFLRAG